MRCKTWCLHGIWIYRFVNNTRKITPITLVILLISRRWRDLLTWLNPIHISSKVQNNVCTDQEYSELKLINPHFQFAHVLYCTWVVSRSYVDASSEREIRIYADRFALHKRDTMLCRMAGDIALRSNSTFVRTPFFAWRNSYLSRHVDTVIMQYVDSMTEFWELYWLLFCKKGIGV